MIAPAVTPGASKKGYAMLPPESTCPTPLSAKPHRKPLWFAVAWVVAAALSLSITLPSTAQAAEKTTKPRSQVEDVPGEYIQLETLWVPIRNRAKGVNFLGLVVRLWPGPETRYEACIASAKIGDALLVAFNKDPMGYDIYQDDKKLLALITSIVHSQVEAKVYMKIETFREFVLPDQESGLLTITCR
jgi:hypothetical protein